MAIPNERLGQYGQMYQEEQAHRGVSAAYHQGEELVRHHPASSALVTFGIGFGLGLAITTMLLPERHHGWYESYVPEGFSRRKISDAVNRVLPDALARYMGR